MIVAGDIYGLIRDGKKREAFELLAHGPLTRAELGAQASFGSTVNDAAAAFKKAGVVTELEPEPGSRASRLQLNPKPLQEVVALIGGWLAGDHCEAWEALRDPPTLHVIDSLLAGPKTLQEIYKGHVSSKKEAKEHMTTLCRVGLVKKSKTKTTCQYSLKGSVLTHVLAKVIGADAPLKATDAKEKVEASEPAAAKKADKKKSKPAAAKKATKGKASKKKATKKKSKSAAAKKAGKKKRKAA